MSDETCALKYLNRSLYSETGKQHPKSRQFSPEELRYEMLAIMEPDTLAGKRYITT